jgi:hypothetical protein
MIFYQQHYYGCYIYTSLYIVWTSYTLWARCLRTASCKISLFILYLCRGLGSVLELHNALVSSALDILLKPMSWGISIELGQRFPFSHAYFPSQQSDLLAILTGPLSCKGFLDLVSYISALVHLDNTRTRCSSQKNFQLQPSKGLVKYSSAWYVFSNMQHS